MEGNNFKKPGLKKRIAALEQEVELLKDKKRFTKSHEFNLTPLNLSINRQIFNLREQVDLIDRRTSNCMQIPEFTDVKRDANLSVAICATMLFINIVLYFI